MNFTFSFPLITKSIFLDMTVKWNGYHGFTAFWSIIRDSGYRIPGIIPYITYPHLFL